MRARNLLKVVALGTLIPAAVLLVFAVLRPKLSQKPDTQVGKLALYENEDFSLSHPSDIKILEDPGFEGINGIRVFGPKAYEFVFDISVGISPAKTTKEAAEKSRANKILENKKNISEVKEIMINGQKGNYYDFEGNYIGLAKTDGIAMDSGCSLNRAIFLNHKKGVSLIIFCLKGPYLGMIESLKYK